MIGDTLLGKYRIEKLIYRSNQSEVYKADGLQLGVPVTIKLLPVNQMKDKIAIERFKREGEALEKLEHSNIVRIYEIFELPDRIGIAMEYVEGQNLREWLKGKKTVNFSIATRVIKEIGAALSYAHKNRVIHRDIKPENILIDRNQQAKLSDFGIAGFYEATTMLTKPGSILGTPGYMAPEQYKGDADERSDLFCLGLIFYEMLTGRSPYNADNIPIEKKTSVFSFQARERIKALKDLGDKAPRGVKLVIQKALEIKPRKRQRSVKQFLEELEESRPNNITFDALLESLVVGSLTAMISDYITQSSLALICAIIGGSLALVVNLFLGNRGYARMWAWGAGSVIIVAGVLISLIIPTDSDAGASIAATALPDPTATVKIISETTPTPTVMPLATSTSVPTAILPVLPTATATREPTTGRTEILPAPPPAEKFVTQIGSIENNGCTSCGVSFEISIITNTLRPLPGAVVYISQKNKLIMPNSSRSGQDGTTAAIHFGNNHPLNFKVSHVLVNQGTPDERVVPGDGRVIIASDGDIIRATLRWDG